MAGFEWVIACKIGALTHPHLDPPKYELVLSYFWSEPFLLPADQKTGSTQTTHPICLDYGTVSASIIRSISIMSPSNIGLSDKSALSSADLSLGHGFCQHSDFYPQC